jgi:hypothetical protein
VSVWKLRTRELDVSRGVIMGVINATPDSFSDGGLHLDDAAAVQISSTSAASRPGPAPRRCPQSRNFAG